MTETNIKTIAVSQSKIQITVPNSIVNDLTGILNNLIKDDGLNDGNIMRVVTNLMSAVSIYTKLTGSQKKELILNLLDECVRSNVNDEDLRKTLQTMIQNLVPSAIDIIIDISKKVYTFDGKEYSKCFAC